MEIKVLLEIKTLQYADVMTVMLQIDSLQLNSMQIGKEFDFSYR